MDEVVNYDGLTQHMHIYIYLLDLVILTYSIPLIVSLLFLKIIPRLLCWYDSSISYI